MMKTKLMNFAAKDLFFDLWRAYKEQYEERNHGEMTKNQEISMKNAFFNGANFMLQTIDFAADTENPAVIAEIAENAANAFNLYRDEMESYNATKQ